MQTRSTARMVALLAVLTLLTAACSSDTSSSAPGGGGSSSSSESGSGADTLDVSGMSNADIEADDFTFAPATLVGTAGQTITLTVTNNGSASHTFTIDDQNVDEELEGGDSVEVSVTFPDSGSVRFYCRFHGGGGMEGELTVA